MTPIYGNDNAGGRRRRRLDHPRSRRPPDGAAYEIVSQS